MAKMSGIVQQLKKERDRAEKQLSALNAALSAFVSSYKGAKPTRKRRKLSAKGRANIIAAERARWAKVRAKKKKRLKAVSHFIAFTVGFHHRLESAASRLSVASAVLGLSRRQPQHTV